MNRAKIYTAQLKIGMYVEELDRPWEGTPFLFQGFQIATQKEIQQLQELCQYVWISQTEQRQTEENPFGLTATTSRIGKLTEAKNSYQRRGRSTDAVPTYGQSLREDIEEARELRERSLNLIYEMHQDLQARRKIDLETSKAIISNVSENIFRNPNTMLWLTYLKQKDSYTANHSMNVSTLSMIFGHHFGLPKQSLEQLGLGALLHDMGKMKVPNDILNKPEKLTENEFAVMRKHPEFGVELLQSTRGLNDAVLSVVMSHHERINGRGYPEGLRASAINLYTKMVSIVDVYDAMTSDRVYHKGTAPFKVIRFMVNLKGEFDPILMKGFVQCMGFFPVGSLVELNTGEVGFVISQNKSNNFMLDQDSYVPPRVLLILDSDKRKYHLIKAINLAQTQESVFIVRGLEDGSYGIKVEDHIDEIAAR